MIASPRDSRSSAGRSLIAGLLLLAIVGVAACGDRDAGGLPDDALILVVSTDLSVGPERVLVSAIDPDSNGSLVTDQPVRLAFFAPDGTAREEVEARFIWAIPEVRGLWAATVTFDVPGRWTPAVRTAGNRLVRGVEFGVAAESRTVRVGEQAPLSRSKTTADGPLGAITSDESPDPRLYGMTVSEAVRSGRPSVIVFATPALCTSQTCGPALDTVKEMIDRYPEVNWIHVEVFENFESGFGDHLVEAQAVTEWGLPSEPWVFVVDRHGVVADRFEGAVDRSELEESLAQLVASG